MNMSTFYEKCVYLTIVIFIFTLIFNFVMGLGIFSLVVQPEGTQFDGNMSDYLKTATISSDYEGGFIMDHLWETVLLGSVGGLLLAIATQSTTIIGVYLFCFVFWSAFLNLISVLEVGGFLTGAMWGLVGIGTAVMGFFFIAAVIGMLSGSG